jgi:alpha-tubulin suppressor-like RCC1 family protein
VRVPGLQGVTAVAAGWEHSCAVLNDGTVRCWGANDQGQLGDGTNEDRSEPVPVVGVSGAVGLTLGLEHSCAWTREGEVWCWGRNDFGQAGQSEGVDPSRPARVLW